MSKYVKTIAAVLFHMGGNCGQAGLINLCSLMYAGDSLVSHCKLSHDSGEGGFQTLSGGFQYPVHARFRSHPETWAEFREEFRGPLLQLSSFPGPSLPPPGVSVALLPRVPLDRKSRFSAGVLASLGHT